MRAAMLGVVVALAAACVPGRGQPIVFQLVLEEPANVDPLPVQVSDFTGIVRMVSTEAGGDPVQFEGRGGVANPPGRPDVLVVAWTGGACDQHVGLAISRGGEGRLHLELGTERGGTCVDVGVPRSLMLSLAQPVPADQANLDFLPD